MGSDIGAKSKGTSFCSSLSIKLNILLLSVIIGLCLFIQRSDNNRNNVASQASPSSSGSECAVSFGSYHGSVYNNPKSGTISKPKCLVESKWMKVQQHKVKIPGSSNVIDDWVWIDYHDRINVLVEAPRTKDDGQSGERKFLVFEQSKYALEGRMSKAIVGGVVEPGEQPRHAASREVEEEMGLNCREFYFLGRYRTDVNRGMGWVNSFIATDCKKKQPGGGNFENSGTTQAQEVGTADTERQDMRTITLTELKRAASAGEFLEVQWSATVALALLHITADTTRKP